MQAEDHSHFRAKQKVDMISQLGTKEHRPSLSDIRHIMLLILHGRLHE